MGLKCIQCGNPAEIHQLCRGCFLDSYSNVQGFKEFKLSVCIKCNSYCYGKQFRAPINDDEDLNKAIRKAVYDNTKFERKPAIFEVKAEFPKHEKKHGLKLNLKVSVYVVTEITVEGNRGKKQEYIIKEEEYDIPVKFRYGTCDKCSLAKSKYFEGRVQLRNRANPNFEEAADFIRSEVSKQDGVFITNEADLADGIDFYLTSQKFITPLGKHIHNKFGGTLTLSSSLHTIDTMSSKELYRVDGLIRLPEFNKGDIMKINNKLLYITVIAPKKIVGLNILENNKQYTENHTNKPYEIVAKASDAKEVHVAKRKPHLEVLNPEDYQTVKIENPEGLKIEKDIIKVQMIDGKVYGVSF